MPSPPAAAGGTQVGFRVGDAAPLEGRGRSLRLHELIADPGHTLLLMLGAAEPAAIDGALALAKAVTRRYRPHVRGYVVTRNAAAARDRSGMLLRDPTGAAHMRRTSSARSSSSAGPMPPCPKVVPSSPSRR